MAQAPTIDEVRIKNVAATFALIDWDGLGGVFKYEIQKSANSGPFIPATFTSDPELFIQDATPATEYIYRVRAVSPEYESGQWSYTAKFKTFLTNSYAVVAQSSVSIYQNFIDEKLLKAQNFVDFNNDSVDAVLIREGYTFANNHQKLTDVEDFILFQDESLKIYGDVSAACGDRKSLMPVSFGGILYMFESNQSIVRYSTNNAISWKTHSGVSGKAGKPVGAQIGASSDSTLYVIGMDGIYTLNFVTDLRFSSISDKFSSINDTFTGGKVGDFKFGKLIGLPSGVSRGQIDAIGISDDFQSLYVAALDTIYRLRLDTLEIDQDPVSPGFGQRIWSQDTIRVTSNGNARVKNLIGFGDHMYAFVSGESLVERDLITECPEMGIYQVDFHTSSTRVYGEVPAERELLDPILSNLSRSPDYLSVDTHNKHYNIIDDGSSIKPATPGIDPAEVDPSRVDYASRYEYTDSIITTNIRPYRQPVKSFNGDVWFAREENYHYESQYLWYSGNRIWVNYRQRLCVIERQKKFVQQIKNTSETLTNGTYRFLGDSFSISEYPGYTIGAIFYKRETGDLIGFYNLGYRTRDKALFTWVPDRTIATAILASNEIDIIEPPAIPDNEEDIVPPLEPFVYQMLPEHFIQSEPLYVEFVEEYLKFLSSDEKTDYGTLCNLIRNHDVNETSYIELFQNDLSRRNVYLPEDKWTELLKFVTNRSFDIYSIKGIKESYEFLFKFLYNETVVVTTDSDSKYEFDIIVDSQSIVDKMVGNKIQTITKSGQADVVYYDVFYSSDGQKLWRVTLNNIIGEFLVGEQLESPVVEEFDGSVVRSVSGKEKPLSNQAYLDRGATYYNIRLQSELQVSKYRDDVLRFVHPVGFGFVGIMLLTMFINSGVSTKHRETIIDILQTLKWDAGLPKLYPEELPDLNIDGSYKRDQFGEIIYKPFPLAGDPFPLTPEYLTDNPGLIAGQNADERRKTSSYLLDSSNMRFIESRKLVKRRLKDGINQRKDV